MSSTGAAASRTTTPPPPSTTNNNSGPTINFPIRLNYDVHIGAVFLLQCLAAFFTFSTVTSSFYFAYSTIMDFGGATAPEKQVVYYSLYPTCSTNTIFAENVQRAQRGVCASVYFAGIFALAVILVNFAAIMLYVMCSRNTVLPSGQRAWVLLYNLHAVAATLLVVLICVASGLYSNLKVVLDRNRTVLEDGGMSFSWGFAFNILAILAHIAVVMVLHVATGMVEKDEEGDAGGGIDGEVDEETERLQALSASTRGKQQAAQLEEGGGGRLSPKNK